MEGSDGGAGWRAGGGHTLGDDLYQAKEHEARPEEAELQGIQTHRTRESEGPTKKTVTMEHILASKESQLCAMFDERARTSRRRRC